MYVRNISLINFRNHESVEIKTNSKFILISGSNGAGKTNILEAVSLLSPGRGLRGAKFDHIIKNTPEPANDWVVRSEIESEDDSNRIATAFNTENNLKRLIKINETVIKKHSDVLDFLRIIWLTPQMDGIFISSPSTRRKFIDRLSYNFFPEHARNVSEYEHYNRSRLKIIADRNYDEIWVGGIERKIAEKAIAIAKTRVESLDLMNDHISKLKTHFLKPHLRVKGNVEELISEQSDDEIYNNILAHLKSNRIRDAKSKRSNYGTHLSDLKAINTFKNIEASYCSTGEQKAMLISVLLGQIKAMNSLFKCKPIVLLDEVFAHLDEDRREQLANELKDLDAQIWITSTDDNLNELFPESVDVVVK